MAVNYAGLRPKSDCSGKAQMQLYSKLQTITLVREGIQNFKKTQLSEENFKEKVKLVAGSRWALTPRLTGRLTVGRNVTSTSTGRWIMSIIVIVIVIYHRHKPIDSINLLCS
jgi:hypothetical protein